MKHLSRFENFGSGEYAAFDNDAGESFWGNQGSGAILFSKSTKRFLVVYRSKYVNEPNCYGVVGGKIDDTENPKDAVFREISEEVGYDGNINLIPLYIFKTKNFTYHNFLGVIDEEFTPHLDWESDGYKWVTFDELLKIEPKHFGLEKLLNDEESIDIIKKVLN